LMLTMILRILATSKGKTIVFDYTDFFLIVQVAKLATPVGTGGRSGRWRPFAGAADRR